MIFDMTKRKGREEVFYNSHGIPYAKDLELPCLWKNEQSVFMNSAELETVTCNETGLPGSTTYRAIGYFRSCPKLRSAKFPYIQGLGNSFIQYFLGDCPNLIEAVFGSVGYPLSEFNNTSYSQKVFSESTNANLVITIYTSATALADVPSSITAHAPWGATNATIVYRNSTTGEVLT